MTRPNLNALNEENRRLKERISELESRLSFLESHKTLAEGIRGEKLISGLTAGKTTSYAETYDVVLENGRKIEVKSGQLNKPDPDSSTLRWAWGKILGERGMKNFDFLLLVGVIDGRFRCYYKDKSSPYIFFLVPYDEVIPLTIKTGNSLGIQLTTNPLTAQSRAAPLYMQYQITATELREKFGL